MTRRKTFDAAMVFLPVILIIGAGIFLFESRPGKASAFESLDKPQDNKSREEMERKERQLKEIAAREGEWEPGFRLGDKAVKGAPFSAQLVIEMTQTLANGTRISHQSTGALYRDGEGRTRSEQPGEGAPEIVVINDPVGGVFYKLHMFQRKVLKVTFGAEGHDAEVKHKRDEGHAREMGLKRREEEHARQSSSERGGKEIEPERKIESLGTQTLEGVRAEGTRSTITFPAGTEGNDRPFDIVSEKWYSPELQAVLMIKRSDPRKGEQVYRLTGINRSEPPRSLFEAPPDFAITEEKVEGRRKE